MNRKLYPKLIIGFLAYNLAVLVPIYLFAPAANAIRSIPAILFLFLLAAAVVLILVLLSGLALRRGTSERPAVVDVKRPLLHSQKPEGTLLLYWFHFRHGVHWRTAEPRDRYLQLIGEETGT
ncbi:MAG: hypothetical protein P8Y03_09375 [Anaerolineales bacterium]